MTAVGTVGFAERVEQPPASRPGGSAGAVLAVDVSGQVIYVNATVESLTGRARQDLLGQPLSTVFRSTQAGETHLVATLTRLAMGENRRVWLVGDWLLSPAEDPTIAIEFHAAPIHDRAGSVTGAVVFCCNVATTFGG